MGVLGPPSRPLFGATERGKGKNRQLATKEVFTGELRGDNKCLREL